MSTEKKEINKQEKSTGRAKKYRKPSPNVRRVLELLLSGLIPHDARRCLPVPRVSLDAVYKTRRAYQDELSIEILD